MIFLGESYIMDTCVFKLIFIIRIENDAILIDKTHNWRDPTRASQKVDNDIEKPVLKSNIKVKSIDTFSPSYSFPKEVPSAVLVV